MKKKLAIIKNGYDILRIIEGKSDGDNCEFKICFMNGIPEAIDISYQQLFSKPKYLQFDNTKEWEITYHKSTISKPTKIHMKRKEKIENELQYLDLPLKELIDPDVNTEIPIPLLKIHVSENALKNKYVRKKDHMIIDIEDNNSIEVFMTKSDSIEEKLYEKWKYLYIGLMSSGIQYWVTNNYKYILSNLNNDFYSMPDDKARIVAKSCTITDDVGIFVNTIKVTDLATDRLSLLFIENAAYLGFLTHAKYYDEENPNGCYLYEKDFENEKYFDDKEKRRCKYIFDKYVKKTDKLLRKYKDRYDTQEKLYKAEINRKYKLTNKCEKFLNALLQVKYNFYKEKEILKEDISIENLSVNFFNSDNIDLEKYIQTLCKKDLTNLERWMLIDTSSYAREIHLLLAKYLEIEEPIIFSYIIKGKNFDENKILKLPKDTYIVDSQNLIFENVRLFYDDEFDVELLRDRLNDILEVKKEEKILITRHFNDYSYYYKFAISSKVVEEDKYKIIDADIWIIRKNIFEELMNRDDCLLEKVYEMIIKNIDE